MQARRVATAPYGSWPSPIAIDVMTAGRVSLGAPRVVAGAAYWLEGRPAEGGRQVLVRQVADTPEDVTPPGFNVRTRVHEYGGGAFVIDDDGTVFFSSFNDGRIYRQSPGADAVPVTRAGAFRYADLVFDRTRNRLICIHEDHSSAAGEDGGDGQTAAPEPVNTVAAIELGRQEGSAEGDHGSTEGGHGSAEGDHGSAAEVLVSGNDFYSSPRVSPDGRRLAWLTWNHPNLPWDGTELWEADFAEDGSLANVRQLAGGTDESIFQPEWSPTGDLYFASDRSGWWNLYRLAAEELVSGSAAEGQSATGGEAVAPMEADIGRPQWVFAMLVYGFTPSGELYAIARSAGRDRLLRIRQGEAPEELPLSLTEVSTLVIGEERALLAGGSEIEIGQILELDLRSGGERVLRRSSEIEIPPAYISKPRLIEFPTEGDLTAFALYYPPHNPDFHAPDGERPPLVVSSHGGPTAWASWSLSPQIQVFTSRGIGYLDVDYGGSTGYGRAYWKRLEENWGVVDVDDCVNAARHLAEQGEVDPERIAITGGSAGGYTTLAALTFRDFFKAGVSYFGIGNLESFREETHKFEAQYDQRLVGRWPEHRQRYHDRSPANFPERLSAPTLILQGLDDRIVPPSQAEQMVAALKENGIPHAYLAFEGEDHGFRKAENIRRSLEAELSFYAQVFGFELADDIEPVRLEGASAA